jgi:hypothetical protein
MTKMNNYYLYLDDVRTPKDGDWIVVRDYEQFVSKVKEIGLENFHTISLDHDLGDSAMKEYFNNVSPNFKLDYDNIKEKTGLDCAKWLVEEFYTRNPARVTSAYSDRRLTAISFPRVLVHSANPIGSANIMGYINNFLMNEGQPQDCVRVKIPHTR